MKGMYLLRTARQWPAGTALCLFLVAGQAMAAGTISGKVTVPTGKTLDSAVVVATSDKYTVNRASIADDGTYTTDVDPGTYTVVAVARGFDAPPAVTNVVVADGKTITENFTLKTATPFCLVKSPNPIPLTDDINAASFMDAPDILVNGGQNVGIVKGGAAQPDSSFTDWSPSFVSGRFRVKYSTQAIHLAGDVTYKQPRVNNQTDPSALWNGNALEFDFQNDPYDPSRTTYDTSHDWQLIVGLGQTPDWWLYRAPVVGRPAFSGKEEKIDSHILIKDKPTNDGELIRLDIPWAIYEEAPGKAITPPADNALGAMDVVLDAAGPNDDRTMADRNNGGWQLGWAGYEDSHQNPSSMRPIQFCPQAPAAPTP